MTLPVFRVGTQVNGGGAQTLNVTIPVAVQVGDVMYLSSGIYGFATMTTPAGWTLIRDDVGNGTFPVHQSLFVRRATAGDVGGATVVSITYSIAGQQNGLLLVAYGGVAAVQAQAATVSSADGATLSAPSVTSITADCLALQFYVSMAVSGSPVLTTSATQRQSLAGGSNIGMAISEQALPAAGASGVKTATGAVGAWVAQTLIIQPVSSPYEAVVLADSPVGFWPMTEAAAPLANLGSEGTALTVYSGFPLYQDTALLQTDSGKAPKLAQPAVFNVPGVVAYSSIAPPPGALTVEVWIRPTAATLATAASYFMTKEKPTQSPWQFEWELSIVGHKVRTAAYTTDSNISAVMDGATSLVADQVYHVVWTYLGSDGTAFASNVYVNGVLDGHGPRLAGGVPSAGAASPVWVGGISSNGAAGPPSNLFEGNIGWAAVYNTVLSASSVLAHYQAGVPASQAVLASDSAVVLDLSQLNLTVADALVAAEVGQLALMATDARVDAETGTALAIGPPAVPLTPLVGGLRARLIFDSIYKCINDGLTALGWFTAGRHHAPVTFLPEPQDVETEVPLNTLALSDENVSDVGIELGSGYAEHTRHYYVDFFGEDDAVGKHLIGDVRDILEGRMPSIGRAGPMIPIYDFRQATPPVVFWVDAEQVQIDRAHNYPHPWAKHWYSVQLIVLDTYGNEVG